MATLKHKIETNTWLLTLVRLQKYVIQHLVICVLSYMCRFPDQHTIVDTIGVFRTTSMGIRPTRREKVRSSTV